MGLTKCWDHRDERAKTPSLRDEAVWFDHVIEKLRNVVCMLSRCRPHQPTRDLCQLEMQFITCQPAKNATGFDPKPFYVVCRHFQHFPLFQKVVLDKPVFVGHGIMFVLVSKSNVSCPFVREDDGIGTDILPDDGDESLRLPVWHDNKHRSVSFLAVFCSKQLTFTTLHFIVNPEWDAVCLGWRGRCFLNLFWRFIVFAVTTFTPHNDPGIVAISNKNVVLWKSDCLVAKTGWRLWLPKRSACVGWFSRRAMSFLPHQIVAECLVLYGDRTPFPLSDTEDDDIGFGRDSTAIVLSLGDENFIDFDDFVFTAKSPLHRPVLVSDERVDQFGDVTQIPPHCSTVEA